MKSKCSADHDNSYKLLFSHPQMVEDLLSGFVREDWISEVDFTTLEAVSGSFVSDDLTDRHNDIIWRVRLRGNWLYVYLLLEFQSSVDSLMALRVMTYVGLLYQELARSKQLTPEGKLPPVLPVVLYNGIPRWQAATDISELVEYVPGGLAHYRPQMSYLLLDEGALDESEQFALRNLAAALFRLEKSASPEDMGRLVSALVQWLKAPEQTNLRRAFTVWIYRVLLPNRMPGAEIKETQELQEVETMLAERVRDWTRQWHQEGRQEGRQEGKAETMLSLLEVKFGPEIPAPIRQQVMSADPASLQLWLTRVLTATTLDEVFAHRH